MRRRLLASYLTITLVTLLILIIPFGLVFSSRERDHLLRDIEHDAGVVAGLVEDALERGDRPQIDMLLTAYDHDPGGRIVVVDASARSVADSLPTGTTGVSFGNRPEIVAALKGARAEGIRRSNTLGTDLLFVAVPVTSSGVVHGAVRITYPSSALDERVREVWVGLGALAFVVIAVVAAVGFAMARLVTRPVDRLKDAARSLASRRSPGACSHRYRRSRTAGVGNDFQRHRSAPGDDHRVPAILRRRRLASAAHTRSLRSGSSSRTSKRVRQPSCSLPWPPRVRRPHVSAESAKHSSHSHATRQLRRRANRSMPPHSSASEPRSGTLLPQMPRVHIETSVPENAWILAVPGALEQILDNLIDNAIEVAPANFDSTRHHRGAWQQHTDPRDRRWPRSPRRSAGPGLRPLLAWTGGGTRWLRTRTFDRRSARPALRRRHGTSSTQTVRDRCCGDPPERHTVRRFVAPASVPS